MLNNLEKIHKISKLHLIRELLELEILNILSRESWSKRVAFYGGTALRLAYDSPRFSEDIDLFMVKNVPFAQFKSWIKDLPKSLSEEVTIEDLHQKRKTFFALLLIHHLSLKHRLPIKIELFRNEKKSCLETELKMLKSPFSSLSPLIAVPVLSSLIQMKIDALKERSKARDLYDLWYLTQLQRIPFELPPRLPHFQKKVFQNELQVYLPKNQYALIRQLWSLYEHARQKNQRPS